MLILQTTVNNFSTYTVEQTAAFLVFNKHSFVGSHIGKHPTFTNSAESIVATETKCQPKDHNFSNSPCSKLLTHLSLIIQLRPTYVKLIFLLIRTDTEFYFGYYNLFIYLTIKS